MNTIPRVRIAAHDGGWLTTCATCGAEAWHQRRPTADRWAHDHQKTCKQGRRR